MTTDTDNASGVEHFNRSLNLFDATAIIICTMIGSGIFIVSSQMATELHSVWLIILCWVLAGGMAVIGALAYGKMAACWPQVGGQYVYLKNIWGHLTAFLYGWTLFLVINTGSVAAVAIAFAKFLGILMPSVSSPQPFFQLGGIALSSQTMVALALILLLTAVNVQGVKFVARIQNLVTVSNVLALVLIVVCGVLIGFNPTAFTQNFTHIQALPFSGIDIPMVVSMALVGPLFALDGWQNVGFIAAEIQQPEKKLPLALLLGTSLVAVLYVLVNIVYAFVLPLADIMQAKNGLVGVAFMRGVLGPVGEVLITCIILVATFGCVNSMLLAGSRLLYVMAKDGLFFKQIGTLGKRSKVPEVALLYQCGWSMLLVLSGSYSNLLDYMVVASLVFYALTVGGLFRMKKLYPEFSKTLSWRGYPILPALFCVLCALIEISLLVYRPIYAFMALLIILSGIPIYYLWRKLNPVAELTDTIPSAVLSSEA